MIMIEIIIHPNVVRSYSTITISNLRGETLTENAQSFSKQIFNKNYLGISLEYAYVALHCVV